MDCSVQIMDCGFWILDPGFAVVLPSDVGTVSLSPFLLPRTLGLLDRKFTRETRICSIVICRHRYRDLFIYRVISGCNGQTMS